MIPDPSDACFWNHQEIYTFAKLRNHTESKDHMGATTDEVVDL